mmetsp:Transcript_10301/g.38200  ORF Transcript_10301/g.38200 Transcript_10301/m.38200 type:complete len:211 (+) Transcript_10301:63-695(+)
MPAHATHDVDTLPGGAPIATDEATDAAGTSGEDTQNEHFHRSGVPHHAEGSDIVRDNTRHQFRVERELLITMKRMHQRGEMTFDHELCADAALNGHFEMLKWARANGCPWDSTTCANAALKGNLEMLDWARANGCDWDAETCANAARLGRLEVLKWARVNGCPWDERTCTNAVLGGHLEVLKWARANNCPWDEDTGYIASLAATNSIGKR